MSANILDGLTPQLNNGTTEDGGVFHKGATTGHYDLVVWDLPDQAALETNQTYHVGLSVRGAATSVDSLWMAVGYKDASGARNWVKAWLPVHTSWGRVEGTIIVPSGMTPFAAYITAFNTCPETWMANPTLSLGSPVPLASSAHTPYATQDHLRSEYATKAALKVTSDAVTAEVSARAQTDRNVADLSSRLTQTANSLTSEISDRKSAITTVTGLANAASSTASAAKSTAQTAASDAATAKTNASSAVSTANAASGTASKASTDAAAAVKTANAASSTASSAVATANGAVSTANAASSTANTAKSTADTAKSTADSAKAAAGSAQSTADTAVSNAAKAQTMATENRSSIKQLSDSITAEVTARTKTDTMVSEVSSRLTQTADGFSASISKLSETDKKVNSWFDFDADSSGNPQLKMGSSTSPVVGTYTNTGLAYRSRDGATIMELDASRSATVADHMEAQDMQLGKWKWVQTQGGTHLTLVWAG